MNIIQSIEGNRQIKERIMGGTPFIASKMGGTEQNIMMAHLHGGIYSNNNRNMASENAGITPPNDETLNFFSKRYGKALTNTDMIGSMNMGSERKLIGRYTPDCIFSELRYLEPFYFQEPWSEMLENKKVLVIHPFEDTIRKQYSKHELLFENEKTLPNFELLTIKAEQTNGGGMVDSKSFIESLEIMEKKIDNIDFDIALIGCGAYGLLLADYIKNKNKQAIHIGGGLQILFGIKGKRWDVHPEISALYNEHWCRPSDDEKTTNYQVVEGGTYW